MQYYGCVGVGVECNIHETRVLTGKIIKTKILWTQNRKIKNYFERSSKRDPAGDENLILFFIAPYFLLVYLEFDWCRSPTPKKSSRNTATISLTVKKTNRSKISYGFR